MGQLAWNRLINGGWEEIANAYVFDSRLLTNNRPYFAAYVKPADLVRVIDRQSEADILPVNEDEEQ